MHYVMSDVHGDLCRYQQLLSLIKFSTEDTLYLIGDAIDRGTGGIDILRDVMSRPNIVMLLGNHEHMCLEALGDRFVPGAMDAWRQNGGVATCSELVNEVVAEEREAILRFLSGLPTELTVEVAGQRYYLVHGFPGDSDEDRVWARPMASDPSPLPAELRIIVGHTPVPFFYGNAGAYMAELEAAGEHVEIAHFPGFIAIDCGCGHGHSVLRLACLRLEDGEEFYL